MNAASKSPSPVLAGANQATRQITESDAGLSEIAKGKVTTNSPWSLFEMWNWHREPDTQHFRHG